MPKVIRVNFGTLDKKLNSLKQAVPNRNFLVKGKLIKILDSVRQSKIPSEREMLQESGIYSYKSHNKKSYQKLTNKFPKKLLKKAPKLVGWHFTYIYADIHLNKKLRFKKITPNIVRSVLDEIINRYHTLRKNEKADYDFMIKYERKRRKASRKTLKKDKSTERPQSEKPDRITKEVIPPSIASGYSMKDAIDWHLNETGHSGYGFVVIGVYNEKSIRPFFIPNKLARYKRKIMPNDGIWVSKYDLSNLSQKKYGHKYIMSLKEAFEFRTNPFWQIIDLNAKIEPQIDEFCFCMMLNGEGDGSDEPYANRLLNKLDKQ